MGDRANDPPAVCLMLGLEGRIGAIALGGLLLGPGHEQGEAHAMEQSQGRCRVLVADAQPIFHGRTVQSLMGPVFNAPLIPVAPRKSSAANWPDSRLVTSQSVSVLGAVEISSGYASRKSKRLNWASFSGLPESQTGCSEPANGGARGVGDRTIGASGRDL